MTLVQSVIVERSDGIVTLTLNRPERRNAIDAAMWVELDETFRAVASNSGDRVLVVTGAGGAFCSGADLGDAGSIAGQVGEPYLLQMRRVADVILALHRMAKPTIAKVTGAAVGAGLSLALGCDLIVSSDDARFSTIFSGRGLSVDGGASWLLPRLVGLHRAKELAFFPDMLSAAQASELGLVNRVLPAAEVDAFVDDWARRLSAGPALALSMTKTMLNHSFAVSMDQALEDEARSQAVNFATEDVAEALAAFSEKRPPVFRGR